MAAFLVAPLADAAVYKCAGTGSQVIYQDAPCAAGRELSNFDRNPPSLSIVPGLSARSRAADYAGVKRETAARSSTRAERRLERTGDATERRHLASGMSEAEVLRRIGRPDMTAGGRAKEGRRWIYLPAEGDKQTVTTVTLRGGTVADVDRKVVY